ncbi:L-2-amino-thiazoline-4-carboxylic acid hydrolase [Nocardia flavorosea]|nr:L-2-amino-thiazoline-4-carboxylic acid hydrolase [Nocardia flavorosea]
MPPPAMCYWRQKVAQPNGSLRAQLFSAAGGGGGVDQTAYALLGRRSAQHLENAMNSHRDVRLDSENDIVVAPFFDAVSTEAGDPQLNELLRRRHLELRHAHRHQNDGGPTGTNIDVAMALLAADQILRDRFPDREQRHHLLEHALVEPLADITRQATESALDTAEDPFTAMVATARQRETYSFGPRFVFTHPIDSDSEFVSNVQHCFFHELLAGHGAGHLTSILCAFDANWMDAVIPERHGFTVDRASTIATGGRSCPFRFHRTGREPIPAPPAP